MVCPGHIFTAGFRRMAKKNADYTLTASTAGSTTNKVGTYAIVDNMDNALVYLSDPERSIFTERCL